jgi:nitroreductase
MLSYAAMSIWTDLLETAVHTPSPHNVQPWRIRIVSETQADLLIDSARTLPKEDLTGSFIILTMGMFIEALRLLAANKGFHLQHSTYHEPSWFAREILNTRSQTFWPFARLELTATKPKSQSIHDPDFLKRRTSRISLKPDPIPVEIIQTLKSLSETSSQRFEVITDSNSIERILDKNTEALFEDLNNADYHDEIVQWFRFTDKKSREARDGLDYRCMNTSRTAFWLSARAPQLLRLPLTSNVLARVYRSQLGVIPTIGMLAGEFWAPESALGAGIFLMQFWLATAQHNLYIHPFGNLVTNKKAAAWLSNETGVSDIWLIFKIGYSDEPPKSYRRTVEEILLD